MHIDPAGPANTGPVGALEIRRLRYFAAVAEELHFGRAAARLGIAQPPLSQQIQRLERDLGVQLFRRVGRRVELTEAGAVLLRESRRLLADVQGAIEATQRAARGETGSLVVAFAASVMFGAMAHVIRRFRAECPAVTLELRELPTGPQLELLRTGRLDIGLVREPPADPALRFLTVLREPLVLAVSREHRLARRHRVRLAEVAREPFVLFPAENAPGLHAQVLELCAAAGVSPNVVQESRELYTTVSLVDAGLGVSIVPASVRALGFEGVRFLTIASLGAITRIDAAWPSEATNPVIPVFLDVVRAALTVNGRAR
jgi:DNA-binding transcriptional LysR family regulator